MALQRLLENDKISRYLTKPILDKFTNRIPFERKGSGGAATITYGYEATLLIDLCDILIQAQKDGNLTPAQEKIADQASNSIKK